MDQRSNSARNYTYGSWWRAGVSTGEIGGVMGFWEFEKDTTQTCLEHLGDYIPESIQREAKQELRNRGFSEERIREEEWKRTR